MFFGTTADGWCFWEAITAANGCSLFGATADGWCFWDAAATANGWSLFGATKRGAQSILASINHMLNDI